jgi:RNA polymerase sigma-70 factor (ECF subfamily)
MDTTGFKQHILPLSSKLYHYAYMLLKDMGEAEDAVQEVCLKLWKIRDSLEHYNSIEAFAMKVTRNWCLDRLKARKPVYIESYHSLLDKLPEQQRQIIQLRELESMEFEEIAEIMDMNINAIRVNLSRARSKIREEMIKYESDGCQSNPEPAGKIRRREYHS